MPENIITPLRLWQGFNPCKQDLNLSFVASESVGEDIIKFGCYFTSESAIDGDVRAFATIYYSEINRNNPTLIFIPDYWAKTIDFDFLRTTISDGYNLVIVDYSGKSDDEHYTHYPPSLSYLNINESGDHLYKAIPSARETCVFNWSKLVRRAITLVESLEFLNSDIALIGIKEGANMMWQAGSMDSRVKTIIPIINAGWNNDFDTLAENGVELDDERERWLAACTAESYAQFINCPIFFLGASNSTITAFDRVRDTFDLFPEGVEHNMVIASDSGNQIQMTGLNTLERWMNHVFEGGTFPNQPDISYEINDGALNIYVESDAVIDISEVVLNYAYGSVISEFRFWNKQIMGADLSGKSFAKIDVYDKSEPIIAFANVFYKDGSQVSSDTITIDASASEIEEVEYHNERILFERKNGVRNFIIENDGFIVDKDKLKMEAGPFNIQGIMVEDGYLSTYILGDKRYKGYDGALLQFDLYSKNAREVEIILYTDDNQQKTEYSVKIKLDGGEKWQKFALSAQDFNNPKHQYMRSWRNIKKMTIKNSENVILSNMLWV